MSDYPYLTSPEDRRAIGYSYDRRGVECACQWSSTWDGDACPDHGGAGAPIASEEEARGRRIAELLRSVAGAFGGEEGEPSEGIDP